MASAQDFEVKMFRLRCAAWIVSCSAIIASASVAAADDTIIKQFSSGTGADAVGIVEAGEDIELSGPQALTLDKDGNVFLLDQINGRILKFDPRQPAEQPAILKMPDDVQPTDIVVRADDILVWDGSVRTLKAAAQSTRGISTEPVTLEEVITRGIEDPFVTSAFAQMGSQLPGAASELLDESTRAVTIAKKRPLSRQFVSSRGKGSVVADVVPKTDSSVHIEVRSKDDNAKVAELDLRVRNRLGAVEFLEIDNSGRLYVLAEDIPESTRQASTFVARFKPDGKLEGIYELPLANTPLTRRFVAISGDGDVFFLRTKADSVAVVGVGFRQLTNAQPIDVRPLRQDGMLGGTTKTFGAIAAIRPSNRQQVVETAFAFEGLQWNLTPANYGSDPDSACSGFSRIRRPWYLQGKVNQQVRGVPYCWGCHGSLASFRAQIDRGIKAGNVCTRDTPRGDVAGVDCSAFVSATWGLSVHYTTAAIPAIARPLENPWDLRPGDALNKAGSHVMLFLRFTPDRKAEVMEASTGGCNGRVCRNVYPLAALLARGYVPVRFRGLADDQMVVSAAKYKDDAATSLSKKSNSRRK
jgi:hypothetical protein